MYVSFNHLGLRCEISTIKHRQFCVVVSGYKLRDPIIDPLFDTPFMTPTLHVIGKTDIIVVEERSMLLVEASGNARVEEHEGGGCSSLLAYYGERYLICIQVTSCRRRGRGVNSYVNTSWIPSQTFPLRTSPAHLFRTRVLLHRLMVSSRRYPDPST